MWSRLKIKFMKPHIVSTHSAYSDNCYRYFSLGCLIELSFTKFNFKQMLKVSASHLEKKVLFLKEYIFGRSQYQIKKDLFTDKIFQEGFVRHNLSKNPCFHFFDLKMKKKNRGHRDILKKTMDQKSGIWIWFLPKDLFLPVLVFGFLS